MFEIEINELYNYLTKSALTEKFSIIKSNRRSIVLYEFNDFAWVLKPNESNVILSHHNFKRLLKDGDITNIMFIDDIKPKNISTNNCRKLTKRDIQKFNMFSNSCSKEDRQEGMVSLDDYLVYGLFENGNIVAVASLWNWGSTLCDVGVLVHPDYRRKGYAKSVCIALIKSSANKYIWRCDAGNSASKLLAESIGFASAGSITGMVI